MDWDQLIKRVNEFPSRHPQGSIEADFEWKILVLELLAEIAGNTKP